MTSTTALGASESEASRLAARLRGESRRDATVLSQRLLSELYGSDTVTLPEADYLAVVRGKLAADPGYATSLYKQVGPRRFVETMAAVRGLSPTDLRRQALTSAEGRERAARAQALSPAPPVSVTPAAPAGQFVGPAEAPSLPDIEGAPV